MFTQATHTIFNRQHINNLERQHNMASLAEKEKMLTEAGLYKAPRQNPNRTNIGALR